MMLPPPLEPPSHSTLEPQRMSPYDVSYREKVKLEFERFPTPNCWQLNFSTEVGSVSYHASDVTSWIREIEAAQNIDDLRTSQSITGKHQPDFAMLDAKIATALKKVVRSTWKSRKPKQPTESFKDDRSPT